MPFTLRKLTRPLKHLWPKLVTLDRFHGCATEQTSGLQCQQHRKYVVSVLEKKKRFVIQIFLCMSFAGHPLQLKCCNLHMMNTHGYDIQFNLLSDLQLRGTKSSVIGNNSPTKRIMLIFISLSLYMCYDWSIQRAVFHCIACLIQRFT